MHFKRTTLFLSLAAAAGCTNAVDSNGSLEPATSTIAAELSASSSLALQNVVSANPRVVGMSSPNILSPQLIESAVAQGSFALENPQTVTLSDGTTATAAFYGYDGDGPMLPAAGDLPSATHKVEATKTEPDKNTYLVLTARPAPMRLRLRHALSVPGPESGRAGLLHPHQPRRRRRAPRDPMADDRHRRRAAADHRRFDLGSVRASGSCSRPRTRRDAGSAGHADFPSVVEDISGALGRGGYEGVQIDSDGNLWIVEDVGGAKPAGQPARQAAEQLRLSVRARSDKDDLTRAASCRCCRSRRSALASRSPSTRQADADITSPTSSDLHTYGTRSTTTWVTIHDTDVDGSAPFDANAPPRPSAARRSSGRRTARSARARDFREFFFDETGDTDAQHRGRLGVRRLRRRVQADPEEPVGRHRHAHARLPAATRPTPASTTARSSPKNQVVFVEDAGDSCTRSATRSTRATSSTSGRLLEARHPAGPFLAEGRDAVGDHRHRLLAG